MKHNERLALMKFRTSFNSRGKIAMLLPKCYDMATGEIS
jgi:hypothetical protein